MDDLLNDNDEVQDDQYTQFLLTNKLTRNFNQSKFANPEPVFETAAVTTFDSILDVMDLFIGNFYAKVKDDRDISWEKGTVVYKAQNNDDNKPKLENCDPKDITNPNINKLKSIFEPNVDLNGQDAGQRLLSHTRKKYKDAKVEQTQGVLKVIYEARQDNKEFKRPAAPATRRKPTQKSRINNQ